jgi:hypothetical protein
MNDHLYQFATVRQIEILEAIEKTGSQAKATKLLGVSKRSVERSMQALRRRAAQQLASEHDYANKPVPQGYTIRGVSQYVGDDGIVKGTWIKSGIDDQQREAALREFAENLAEGIKGLAPITKAPKHADDDLMCVYPLGDPHFGMYAWWRDAGADFDLATAENITKAAIDRLVSSAPNAGTALLLNLGDMFHADNQSNQTQSGHQLDVDGRWPKVQQVGLMCMVHCILRLLEKHQKVIFRINKGNHDKHSSQALALMLSCWFRNEPRVEVDLSPSTVWYYKFGKVLMGSTHGDEIKGKDMMAIMAVDMASDWSDSLHRYWYVGHVHHDDRKEYHGGTVEYMRTLAARDAWHQGQGYRAGRDMRLIVHHRLHGEIERHRCDIGMLG